MQDRRQPQPPATPSEPRPASIFLRAIAILLDMVILFILAVVIIGMDDLEGRTGLAFYLIGWSVYYIGFTAAAAATPGKVAVGIHVAARDGDKAELDSVILRYIVVLVGALPFGIGTVISMLLVATDPQRRALHDRIAGTLVLDGRPPLEEWKRREEQARRG